MITKERYDFINFNDLMMTKKLMITKVRFQAV